jgi:molybdenum cofactor cytidylyltransferase
MNDQAPPASVAGIVLAAGGASRFGEPKQLLLWEGKTLVRHVAEKAVRAALSSVIVVGGEHISALRGALDGLPVSLVHNPDWRQGQSSSVRVGVGAVSPSETGALILLADQPQVPVELIVELKARHAATHADIVAPRLHGRRANPVLWHRRTFDDLASLSGDVGGRVLFSKYDVAWVPWEDAWLHFDVDTPADYRELLRRSP